MNILDGILVGLMCVLFVGMPLLFASAYMTTEEVVITSRVVHVDYDSGFMTVHFLNGDVYRVAYPSDTVIDFDELKNVTVKLQYRNFLWCMNTDHVWDIMNVIKY